MQSECHICGTVRPESWRRDQAADLEQGRGDSKQDTGKISKESGLPPALLAS